MLAVWVIGTGFRAIIDNARLVVPDRLRPTPGLAATSDHRSWPSRWGRHCAVRSCGRFFLLNYMQCYNSGNCDLSSRSYLTASLGRPKNKSPLSFLGFHTIIKIVCVCMSSACCRAHIPSILCTTFPLLSILLKRTIDEFQDFLRPISGSVNF